jgi:hypothetical protein
MADAARDLAFNVYCAVLPSNWWVQKGSYTQPNGGFLELVYKNSSGAILTLWEGGWCPPSNACIAVGPAVGAASFGGLAGTLYQNGTALSLGVGAYASGYMMKGSTTTMSQAQFLAYGAALVKVPRP